MTRLTSQGEGEGRVATAEHTTRGSSLLPSGLTSLTIGASSPASSPYPPTASVLLHFTHGQGGEERVVLSFGQNSFLFIILDNNLNQFDGTDFTGLHTVVVVQPYIHLVFKSTFLIR